MLMPTVLAATLAAAPADVEARIQRVIEGLLPETAFKDRHGPKTSLRDRMAYHHTPGVSIAVVNDGRIEWARGFGVRERSRPEPVTEETLFQAGSISKPIFALGVMRLVEQGKLDLDEDVNRYLKSWKIPANGSWQPRVTLRQILGHSAGLTVHGFPGYGKGEPVPSVVQVLSGAPPANTASVLVNILPGAQFRYSGGGTTVAQLLVTELLGKDFPVLMRELVLDPLGMTRSSYEQPLPGERARTAATAHPWKSRPLPGRWHVYPEMAAAGLWTTASDLARAGTFVQRALRDGEGTLLSRATVTEMLTPSRASDQIGIGFFLEGKEPGVRFGHGGWDEGFVAQMTLYKDAGKGAVVMVNSNEGAPLIEEILRAVAREYDWPGYFPAEKKAVDVGPAVLDAYVGTYVAKAFECSVTRDGGRLFLRLGSQPSLELQALSETEFHAIAVDVEVAFNKGDGGVVKGLSLKQSGQELAAERR